MKNNTIIDKIARTIERKELGKGGVKVLPFLYANLDVQDIEFDNIEMPCACAVPLSSGAVSDNRGNYHEQATIAVFFADLMCQPQPDFNARENERIIDVCKQRAYKWLASLTPTDELELVSVNGAERAYLERDSVVTGYVLNVTLREVAGYGKCDIEK